MKHAIFILFGCALTGANAGAAAMAAPAKQLPPQQATSSAPSLISPRLLALQNDLHATKGAALESFWREVQAHGTPLVEPVPADPNNSLVTFLWRATPETRNVSVILGSVDQLSSPAYLAQAPMSNLPGTDLWYRTYRFRNDARYTYSLSPNDAQTPTSFLRPEERAARMATLQPDPLNAQRFEGRSVLELPHAPPQPWIQPAPGAPAGKVEEHRFKSSFLQNERSIWVYTPPGYQPTGARNDLLLIFDGDGAFNSLAPIILNNLLAKRRLSPIVAVLIGNAPGARVKELWHADPFNEFLAGELMPWVRQHYRVTADPRRTVVAGRSLGGNAAGYAGLKLSKLFGNVLAQSGGFMYRPTRPEIFVAVHPGQFFEEGFPESEFLAREFATHSKLDLRFYLEAGLAEDITWQDPLPRFAYPSLLAATRHLRDVLQAHGYPVHYNEYNGAHEVLSWRGTFADGLIALLGNPRGTKESRMP